MKSTLALLLLLCSILPTEAQTSGTQSRADSLRALQRSRFVPIANRTIAIYDVTTPRSEVGLFRLSEHPAYDSLMTPETKRELLAQIDRRCERVGKDTLLTSELFWVLKPYFEWLHKEDPHCIIEPAIPVVNEKEIPDARRKKIPAFDVLVVNDTVVVNQSLDPAFKPGDRIEAINGVPMTEYLDYTYRHRYDSPANIMRYYHFSYDVDKFDIALERNGRMLDISTAGEAMPHVFVKLAQQRDIALSVKTFPDAKCGYISIPQFYFNNNRVIKITHKAIRKFKAAGVTNIILDLRMNPGGNGHNFDQLLSVFIDKPVIHYQREAKIKASKRAAEVFDFITEDMYGTMVEMPDRELVREFPTNPKIYVAGMNYYVLMSRNTGSIAASFCNIMQYNDAAKLVGEPLLRNAMKYGETLPGYMWRPTVLAPASISIVEFDEYTRAVDGVLMPDIAIPYVAADYMDGGDGMLEKLLEIVKASNAACH